jgi:hypothetical protein
MANRVCQQFDIPAYRPEGNIEGSGCVRRECALKL